MTATSNKELPISLIAVGGLLAAVALVYLVVYTVAADGFGKNMDRVLAAIDDNIEQRIRPVVTLDDILGAEQSGMVAEPGDSVTKSPLDLYNGACMACHAAGVAGAPKLSDKSAWESRMTNGIDGLLATAIAGKGAMPPRGGSAYSDDEIRQVINYMLIETGLVAGSDDTQSAPAAATTNVPVRQDFGLTPQVGIEAESDDHAPSSIYDLAYGERTYQSACFACHGTGAAGAPKLGDQAAWAERINDGLDAMIQSAIDGKGVMPPKGGHVNLSNTQIASIVAYMVEQSR